jgi:hypothetical protein
MATKDLAILERDERLQLLCLNQRGIPTIGKRLRSQSRKTRGGAALSAINNASDLVNKAA